MRPVSKDKGKAREHGNVPDNDVETGKRPQDKEKKKKDPKSSISRARRLLHLHY